MSSVTAVIPARWASTRLPGKPLLDICGLPMVERVRRLAGLGAERVVVATDDERVAAVVRYHGGEVVITADHPTGTHRVAAVAEQLGLEGIVVNVQGDQPLLRPDHVAAVAAVVAAGADIGTLVTAWSGDPSDPGVVKAIVEGDRALWFSRAPVPHGGPYWRHLGLYAFRARVLAACVRAPPAEAERAERLEQLRWLAEGFDIRVARVEGAAPSVDTPEQLAAVRKLIAG